jgi:hypothetical protein
MCTARIFRPVLCHLAALIMSFPLVSNHASAGFVSIAAAGPVGSGDSFNTGIGTPTAPFSAYLTGTVGSVAPFYLSLTVDTPGVYTVYSLRPGFAEGEDSGNIGEGGLVNANGTIWRAFIYQIAAAPPGGSTFAAYIGAPGLNSSTQTGKCRVA